MYVRAQFDCDECAKEVSGLGVKIYGIRGPTQVCGLKRLSFCSRAQRLSFGCGFGDRICGVMRRQERKWSNCLVLTNFMFGSNLG